MGTIAGLRKGLSKLNLPVKIVAIIENTGSNIIALNQGPDQLLGGFDVDGQQITPGYRQYEYSELKYSLNPLPGAGTPDLKLTGAFYKAFVVTAGYTGIFTVDSTDGKAQQLEYKYGKGIYGLNAKNKTIYSTGVFYDELKKYITEKTGLNFR